MTLQRMVKAAGVAVRLIRVAEQNVERLRLGRRVRFVQSDAAEYHDLDRVTHIFMFNPFPCAVVARVLANIEASLRRAPRPLCLVYRHPFCDRAVADSRLFQAVHEERPETVVAHLPAHQPSLWASRSGAAAAISPGAS